MVIGTLNKLLIYFGTHKGEAKTHEESITIVHNTLTSLLEKNRKKSAMLVIMHLQKKAKLTKSKEELLILLSETLFNIGGVKG